MSMEGDISSVSMNNNHQSNIEDEIPFYLLSTTVSFHSRHHSSSSHLSNVDT